MLDDGDPFHCWEDPVVAFHVGPEIDGPVAATVDGGTGSTPLAMAGRAVLLVAASSGGGVCLLELVLRTHHTRRNLGRDQGDRQAEDACTESPHAAPRTCFVHGDPLTFTWARPMLGLRATAPLDAQLGQRTGEGAVDGRDFGIGDLVAQVGRGALARLLSRGFVDVLGGDGHVRDDRDTATRDLDEPFAHRKKIVLTILAHDHLARNDPCHERHVMWVDADLTLDARQRDHVHVFRVAGCDGCDDLQFQRVGHASRALLCDFFDAALHVEVVFRHAVVLPFQYLREPPDGISHRTLSALTAGEHLPDAERLAQKSLYLTRAEHG